MGIDEKDLGRWCVGKWNRMPRVSLRTSGRTPASRKKRSAGWPRRMDFASTSYQRRLRRHAGTGPDHARAAGMVNRTKPFTLEQGIRAMFASGRPSICQRKCRQPGVKAEAIPVGYPVH
jgi:hypothetical protein